MPYKPGKLTVAEQKFIKANVKKMSNQEMAEILNRPVRIVERFILQRMDAPPKEKEEAEFVKHQLSKRIKSQLRMRGEWEELRETLTPKELYKFEDRYAALMGQFKDDVKPSEDTQVFQLIMFEILMQRLLVNQKRAAEEKEKLCKMLDDIYEGEDTRDPAVSQKIIRINEQIVAERAAEKTRTDEYLKMLNQHKELTRELKGARDQRIKDMEERSENILSFIKSLQHTEYREAEAMQLEIVQKAIDKEAKRLGGYHSYVDDSIDKPLLNSDTVNDADV